eukprot:359867-Chlamydomonas_euryale.AAC.2
MLDGGRCRVAQRGTVQRQLGWACGHAHCRGTSAAGHPMGNALGSWAPLRGGAASRIVQPTDARGSGHARPDRACRLANGASLQAVGGRLCARGAPQFVGVWRLNGVFASFPCCLRRVNRSFSMPLRQGPLRPSRATAP